MNYKLKKLRLENFKCISSGEFDFESKNLIVLDGPNGYGKTTLFDAIEIILTGKPRKISDNSNISAKDSFIDSPIHKDNSRPIELELTLKNQNNEEIRIIRTFPSSSLTKSKKNNPQLIFDNTKLVLYKNDEKLSETSKVSEILSFKNIENLFNVLSYVEQDENTYFLKKKPKEKYESLTSLLGVEKQLNQLKKITDFNQKIKLRKKQYTDETKNIEEQNKEISSLKEDVEYIKLLTLVEKEWDKENLNIPNIDVKNSYLSEIERIRELNNNKDIIKDIERLVLLNEYQQNPDFIDRIIKQYWNINNIETLEKENNSRNEKKTLRDKNLLILDYIESSNYKELEKEQNIEVLRNNKTFKPEALEKFIVTLNLINTLKNSLSLENSILEEFKKRRNALTEYSIEFSDHIEIDTGKCPTCGFDWETLENLKERIEITEARILETYNVNNKRLEEQKEILKEDFLKRIRFHLEDINTKLIGNINSLITQEGFQSISKINLQQFNKQIGAFLSLLDDESISKVVELIDIRKIDNIEQVRESIKLIIHNNLPQLNNNVNTGQLYQDFQTYFSKKLDILQGISEENILNKKKYINYCYYNSINSAIKDLTIKVKKLDAVFEKTNRIKETLDDRIKEYISNVIKTISIPFYIFTGKILQEHSLGSGLIFDADIGKSNPQIKIRPINRDQEASYILSSGQLSATVISLMLVLNKVYNTSLLGTILIDDPLQTLDEINTHSLVEVLKYNFSDQQIILSTHEDRYSRFIRYKYDRFGLSNKNINMKDDI